MKSALISFKNLGLCLRVALLGLALFMIYHGIWGPQFAPKNLTTLFVWVHYRGLLVISLLIFGNLLCAGCPLVLTRNIGRRFIKPFLRWPNWLRNKWISISLFIAVLFIYESLDLWASPFYTAILLLSFFVLILIVDLTFKEASFCQYICPVGQFNFLGSVLSPYEVTAKDPSQCTACKTFDCIKGSSQQRGCELKLFIPKKRGNWDCTFCMDCQNACPHENVIIKKRAFAERREFQVFWSRKDLAFLILVFTFSGLLNAFAMVGPYYQFQKFLSNLFRTENETFLLLLQFLFFTILIPALFLKFSAKKELPIKELIPSLLPIAFSIWLAHYIFHLLTGLFTFVPIVWSLLPISQPNIGFWAEFPMGLSATWVTPLQMGIVLLGLTASIICAQSIADKFQQKFSYLIYWNILILALASLAIWLFSLPMEMRGTAFAS